MKFKESLDKFLNNYRLKKEMKIAEAAKTEELQVKKEKKIGIEKLKDFGLIMVAVLLIGAGYVNFSKDKTPEDTMQTASQPSDTLGDVQLVNSSGLVENDDITENTAEIAGNLDNTEDVSGAENTASEETASSSESTSSQMAYFKELKLNRDNIYSQKLSAYEQMVDSASVTSEQKSIAIKEIENLTNIQNSILVAEELIKLKGFEEVVIYANGETVSVVVRSAVLSLEQVAQIQNVVSRELKVDIQNISISSK